MDDKLLGVVELALLMRDGMDVCDRLEMELREPETEGTARFGDEFEYFGWVCVAMFM